ncbi:MAG TPA: aminopeptidase P N-terminal domain-containing protein, partial [Flavobacteriales bacterium]|nr:aminopeptidase P N-terminal domain-containing protein [Flavobacteriales bacterium]
MFPRLLSLLFLASSFTAFAQELPQHGVLQRTDSVDSDKLGPDFRKGRRAALRALLPEHGVAVLRAGTVKNRSNDVDYEFHQDPDFHYLTGVDEPEAVLFVFKEPRMIRGEKVDELLVVRDRNPKAEIWTGERLGADGAETVSGATLAIGAQAFVGLDPLLMKADEVFVNATGGGEDVALEKAVEGQLAGRNAGNGQLSGWMADLRQEKLPEEVALMRKAIDITCLAEHTLMRLLEPNMAEFQAEAIVQYVFTNAGAEHEGYPSIL